MNTNAILNRLLIPHHRSLAAYLSYAAPYWHGGDSRAQEILETMAADQRRTVDRLGEAIDENNGTVDYGEFPMSFTGYHDLDLSFLLNQLIVHQRALIATIESCVDQLRLAPHYKTIAEEALGEARGHLESLEELRAGAVTAHS